MAVAYKILQNGVSATGDGEAVQLVGANSVYEFLYIQIEGITTATVTFEATINESDWFAVSMENLATSYRSTTATEDGSYAMRVGGIRQFRARVSSWASGAIYVYASADDSGDGSSTIASLWPRYGDYLVHDEFTDTVAAGSVNGTAATPGPGTRTVTDTESKLSVGAGVLAIAGGKASPGSGDPGFWYGAQTRATGLALVAKAAHGASGLGRPIMWDSNTAGLGVHDIQFNGAELRIRAATSDIAVGACSFNTTYDLAVVLRSAGALYLIRGDAFTNWTLIWVDSAESTTSLYPGGTTYNGIYSNDFVRAIQLFSPFDTDDGLATDTLSGSVSAGTTFEHEADCLIEFTVTTLPSSGSIYIYFRVSSSGNLWTIQIRANGDLKLIEVVAGIETERAAVNTIVSNGHRVVIIADGTTIKGYSNNVLRWTYSGATNFATATAGELITLSTGGAVSDIKTWPRELDGIAASILNKASA